MTTHDDQLSKAGFTLLNNNTIRRRLIIAIYAQQKYGKTHFGLGAPGPLAYFDIDNGGEGVVEKFVNTKQIMYFPMAVPKGDKMQEEAQEMWKSFLTAYAVALKTTRSVIIDTASELWEILRIARFGRLAQVMSYQYTPVNAEFKDLFYQAQDAPTPNVIFLHRLKAEYVNDKFTGKYIPAWFNKTPYEVQVVGTLRRYDRNEEAGIPTTEIRLHIDDCRHNLGLIGMEFPAAISNFVSLAQMVIPGTKVEDWV